MSNYNEMVGETITTDAGDYTVVAHVHDDGCADNSINLYVGKAADGHHDLIASDNASMWVVGSEDDAELNRDQWDTIAARCDIAPVLDEVRKIDADLADWLNDRYNEARRTVVIYKGDTLRDDGLNEAEEVHVNDIIAKINTIEGLVAMLETAETTEVAEHVGLINISVDSSAERFHEAIKHDTVGDVIDGELYDLGLNRSLTFVDSDDASSEAWYREVAR